MDEIIVVKQLPIIEEQLIAISGEIKQKVETALSLQCTEETVKSVKAVRSELNGDFKALEEKRKDVKSKVLAPYEQFETVYKEYASDLFKSADTQLKGKIDEVEDALKQAKKDDITAFFTECCESCGIDFLEFERANINVTLSASAKSLKEQARAFVDRISDELNLIATQDNSAEILVEYKKNLNCAQSIAAVAERRKAVLREQLAVVEREDVSQREQEVVSKVDASVEICAPIAAQIEEPAEKTYVLAFKVRGTLEKLKQLKQFLNDGGYDYE